MDFIPRWCWCFMQFSDYDHDPLLCSVFTSSPPSSSCSQTLISCNPPASHRRGEFGNHLWVFSLGVEDLSWGRPQGGTKTFTVFSSYQNDTRRVFLKSKSTLSRSSQRTWPRWRLCPETMCWTSWRRASRSSPSRIWSTLCTSGRTRSRSFTMCWFSSTWRGSKASWSSTSTHCQKVPENTREFVHTIRGLRSDADLIWDS